MRGQRTPHKRWINLAVLLIYFAVAVGMTWPLVEEISERLPGASDDTLVHYWNGWWAKRALTTGQSPFYTRYLYYPTGISLVYHNFAWGSIVRGPTSLFKHGGVSLMECLVPWIEIPI